MKVLTEKELIELYDVYFKKLQIACPDIPYKNLHFFENSCATPFVVMHSDFYEYKVIERNLLIKSEKTANADELLYWVFNDILSDLSYQFELLNRVDDQADCRILAFEEKLRLFRVLNPNWAEACYEQIQVYLKKDSVVLPNID